MKKISAFFFILIGLQYCNAQNVWNTIVFNCNMPEINIAYDSSNYKYNTLNENKTLLINAMDTLNNNRGFQEFFMDNTNLRFTRYKNITTTRFVAQPYYYSFGTDTNNRIKYTEYYNFDSCLYKTIKFDYYENIIMTTIFECYYNKPDKCFSKAYHNNKLFQINEYLPLDFLKPDPKLTRFIVKGEKAMMIKSKLYDLEGKMYMDRYFDFDEYMYKESKH